MRVGRTCPAMVADRDASLALAAGSRAGVQRGRHVYVSESINLYWIAVYDRASWGDPTLEDSAGGVLARPVMKESNRKWDCRRRASASAVKAVLPCGEA